MQDDKTYIFSNNVEFQGKDYQIGDGAFKGGGAMGIEFFFSFDVEYYAGFDGDFEIHIDGQNKTDSNHNVEIPDTDYGRRTYNPTLKYVGPTEGISKVEWKDNFGFTFTANAPNFSTQGRAIGDEYPGQKNTYNMKVYYTNGDIYPGTGEG